MRTIVDDIGTVVQMIRGNGVITSYEEDTITVPPYYIYGNRLEIANTLLEKDADSVLKFRKYPLIALRLDFPERQRSGELVELTLNIAFLMLTEEGYNAKQRYANVIKPILYPLVDLFFQRLLESGLFVWPDVGNLPDHDKWDRPFYGVTGLEANEKYIFNDPLDAVELIDLKIRSTNENCK